MKRKLEDIRISSPCSARWEDMVGDELIRFCKICSKNVYNISAMTRQQAQKLINEGNAICGLLYMRYDRKIMTSDCPIGLAVLRKRVAKRVSVLAGFVFAFLVAIGSYVSKAFWAEAPVTHLPKASATSQRPHVSESQVEVLRTLGYIQ